MFYRNAAILLCLASALIATGFVVHATKADDANTADATAVSAFTSTNPPHAAPTFPFEDEKGTTTDLGDFRGRYVLINLWETTCAPCVAELPKLDKLATELNSKNFAVVALDEDHGGHEMAPFFFKRHSIKHLPVYVDSTGRAPYLLKTQGLPTTLLIDPHGMEIARLEGAADWTNPAMLSYLQALAKD